MAPEELVGKTANIIIFLGLLYTVLSAVALLSGGAATQTWWFDLTTLAVAMSAIGLGYGIRYGSFACLYATTGLVALLVVVLGYAVVSTPTFRPVLRLILSGWALFRLGRAIPAMRVLQQTHSKPLATSRYGDFFLRRKAP